MLVYSTCTFSYEENEGTVKCFLSAHPEFIAERIPHEFGREDMAGGLGRRIYPMEGGEGHFVARFRRVGENICRAGEYRDLLKGGLAAQAQRLLEELFPGDKSGLGLARAGDKIFLLPEKLPELSGLGVLRAGVELFEVRKDRLEPLHGAYLRGEELDCEGGGYTAVCVNGVVTGFGKASGGRLKNRYPKGLRNRG